MKSKSKKTSCGFIRCNGCTTKNCVKHGIFQGCATGCNLESQEKAEEESDEEEEDSEEDEKMKEAITEHKTFLEGMEKIVRDSLRGEDKDAVITIPLQAFY